MKAFVVGILLVLLSAGLYSNTLGNGFVNFDDPALLYENPQVLNFNIKEAFTSVVAEDYIPLVTASFAAEYAVFGLDPYYFHLGNLILNALCVALIFSFLFMYCGQIYVAALTALLFAVHPLHVESVAWLAERKDVLSTLFFMVGLILYWRFLHRRPRVILYVVALICFLLSLMAKFMAISFPAILVLLHLQKRTSLKKTFLLQIPFILIGGVFTYIHLLLHNRGQHIVGTEDSVVAALMRGTDSLAFYIHKLIFPWGLSAYYEKGVAVSSWAEYLTLLLFAISVILLAWKNQKFRAAAFFGASFFILTIFPVLQIVSFGNKFAFADRFMYLPSIGLFYFMAVAANEYFEKRHAVVRAGSRLIIAVICFGFAVLTFERNKVWASSETLWQSEVATYPQSSVAQNNLGSLYLDQGKLEAAKIHLQKAAEIRPSYIDPHINLGIMYMDQNKLSEAISEMETALKIDPNSPNANLNMGVILEKLGRNDEAFKSYELAVRLDPDMNIARHNLGVMYYRRKEFPKALELFQATIQRNPRLPETHHNIGVMMTEGGHDQLAIESFNKAAALDSMYLEPHLQLLQIYQRQQNQVMIVEEIQVIQNIQARKSTSGDQNPRARRSK